MNRRRPQGQWAYLYQLVPSCDEPALATIGELLAEQNALARERHSSWNARLVIEDGQARILVVCESPSRNRKANRKLEGQLRALAIEFLVTVPMAIGDDVTEITRGRRE